MSAWSCASTRDTGTGMDTGMDMDTDKVITTTTTTSADRSPKKAKDTRVSLDGHGYGDTLSPPKSPSAPIPIGGGHHNRHHHHDQHAHHDRFKPQSPEEASTFIARRAEEELGGMGEDLAIVCPLVDGRMRDLAGAR